MSGRVTIYENEDDLRRQEWVFWYHDAEHVLYLDEWRQQARASKRHGWKTQREYGRLGRPSDYTGYVPAESVPLPETVLEQAKAEFFRTLKVGIWSRR